VYKKQFNDYVPKCEQECVDKKAIMNFINHNDDCLKRSNLIAHVTASAFVVNETMDKILFIHHNIFNSWGWVGGHNDSNPDLLEVAIKEAKEETGIKNVTPFDNEMISLDVIFVENHIKNSRFVGDHLHLNATYLLIANEEEELIVKKDENSGVKWFKISDVMEYVTEDRIKDVYNKIFNRIKDIKENQFN
jgi:ADP-ribose pyrophosphatase YjhB (NUDIX family)